MIDHRGNVLRRGSTARGPLTIINQITTSTCNDAVDFTANENFGIVLASNINVSELHNSTSRYGNIKSKKGKQVDSATLAKRWGIAQRKAHRQCVRQPNEVCAPHSILHSPDDFPPTLACFATRGYPNQSSLISRLLAQPLRMGTSALRSMESASAGLDRWP